MMEVKIREKCCDCGGTGFQQVPGAFDMTCASCRGERYLEAWLPLSDVFELMARAAREAA